MNWNYAQPLPGRPPRRRKWPWLLLAGILVLGIGFGIGLYLRDPTEYDLIVEGGPVFTGERWLPAGTKIGIRNGGIAKLGRLLGARTKRRIDVQGQVVSPGFIDTHVHIEGSMGAQRPLKAENFLRMGATTLITGNCGTSHKHLPEVIEGLSRNGGQLNVATLVGHKTLREIVMEKDPKGQPTREQLQQMCNLLDQQMRKGAFGLSTGLEYSPGLNAKKEEVAALAKVVARWKGIYATHLRNEGVDLEPSLDEAIETAQMAKVHLHVSHLKIACRRDWGQMSRVLKKLAEARSTLPDLTADAYAYDRSSSGLDLVLPEEYRGFQGDRKDLTRDTEKARRLVEGMLTHLKGQGFPDYSFVRVVWTQDSALRGLTVDQFPSTASQGVIPSEKLSGLIPDPILREQVRSVLGLLRHGGGQMIYQVMSEDDMATALRDPKVVVGSDSSVRGTDSQTAHPRGCGNFPRILRMLVRERKDLTLEGALRKMSTQAAEIFNLKDRGRIAPNYWADLVVLDRATVTDKATYDSPLEHPEGISYVIVNGVVVLEGERVSSSFPGKMLTNDFRDPGRLPENGIPIPKVETGAGEPDPKPTTAKGIHSEKKQHRRAPHNGQKVKSKGRHQHRT